MIYEARGQVILPEGRWAQGPYHLAKSQYCPERGVLFCFLYRKYLLFMFYIPVIVYKNEKVRVESVEAKRVECL